MTNNAAKPSAADAAAPTHSGRRSMKSEAYIITANARTTGIPSLRVSTIFFFVAGSKSGSTLKIETIAEEFYHADPRNGAMAGRSPHTLVARKPEA